VAFDRERIERAVREILLAIGEDPNREGLKDTPKRVAKMYEEILAGYNDSPDNHLVLFSEKYDEMIIVKDIPIYSLCEHHMLPFFGKAHVAYIPGDNKVTGLSKLARIVDVYSKRLQLQERMTEQIATAIMEQLGAKGVMVVIEAQHLCMIMRGVKIPGSYTVTSAVKGVMRREATRMEALFLIKGRP
jgi:GTP cyclohydrolase I